MGWIFVTTEEAPMRQTFLVLGPLLLGAFAIWLVWACSDSPRTRHAFLFAVLGSIPGRLRDSAVLAIWTG
jgi:hypothetical protein